MNIADFYGMPTINTDTEWYYYDKILNDIFDLDIYDCGNAYEHDEKKLVIADKLYKNVDGERSVKFATLSFCGKNFALIKKSGRGGNENFNFFITDGTLYSSAKEYCLDIIRKSTYQKEVDITDPYENIDDLFKEYGYLVYNDKVTGKYKLVSCSDFAIDKDYIEDENNVDEYNHFLYVLDENELRDSFETNVRPITKNMESIKDCFHDENLIGIYCKSIMDAVRIPPEDKMVCFEKNKHGFTVGKFRWNNKVYKVVNDSYSTSYLCWVLEEEVEGTDEDPSIITGMIS